MRISGKGGRLRHITERGYFIDERDSMFGVCLFEREGPRAVGTLEGQRNEAQDMDRV